MPRFVMLTLLAAVICVALLHATPFILQEESEEIVLLPSSTRGNHSLPQKLFILGGDQMGVESLVEAWRLRYPNASFTDSSNTFLQHLFAKTTPGYAPVPWKELIGPYDILYGRLVSFFFRDIIEAIGHEESFQVLIITRCVSDWAQDTREWLATSPEALPIPIRTALYGYHKHLSRELYFRKRFQEQYNLWYDILDQHPQHDVELFAFDMPAKDRAVLSRKYSIPLEHVEGIEWYTRDLYCKEQPLLQLHQPRPLDPIPLEERKSLEILCAGLSKTGTTTFHNEMNKHTPLYSQHYVQVIELLAGLQNLAITDQQFLHDNLPVFAAVLTDTPWNYWALEITHLYPNVAVVLLKREVEEWASSWYCHKLRNGLDSSGRFGYYDEWLWIDAMIYGSSDNSFLDQKRYREINRHVELSVPSDRLLVLGIGDEFPWQRLRPFIESHTHLQLEVDVGQPFSRSNKGSTCDWE